MGFMSIPRMMVSSEAGWRDLERQNPTVLSLFVWMVLPLSILPPALLYYAGTHYGDALIVGWSTKPWPLISPMFFLCELAAFVGMGWFIRSVVDSSAAPIDTHDAYVVAAIAPVPMWLSSLALLVPNLAFVAAVALTGLAASCALMYHGVYALCHMSDEVRAASVTHTVMAAGMLCWAAFLAPILMF
ncbi:Yip1 family protein [Denitromonas sp.]|uniref:Yip1 family protein n=1 Tax=Denitromonas sp. TaxID=2734609 RepID=UPI002AFEB19D|nr:Yip1 family protein [Denitromonas sp.]